MWLMSTYRVHTMTPTNASAELTERCSQFFHVVMRLMFYCTHRVCDVLSHTQSRQRVYSDVYTCFSGGDSRKSACLPRRTQVPHPSQHLQRNTQFAYLPLFQEGRKCGIPLRTSKGTKKSKCSELRGGEQRLQFSAAAARLKFCSVQRLLCRDFSSVQLRKGAKETLVQTFGIA